VKKFKEFIIRTMPFNSDLLSGLLWELNISGFIEENDFIKVFAEKNKLSKKEIESFLKRLREEKLIEEYSTEEYELQNKNWNEEWEKNLSIIKVTDRIVIKPSLKAYIPKENDIVLTIDRKMSFGTGEHQTTKLMLKLIEMYVKPGMKVLDIGSGTAILSIASVKLGADNSIAIDNDELCFKNGNENCTLNNVENKVEVRIGQVNDIAEINFDLILANIQKNILLSIADDVRKKLKTKGFVILSGLLTEDEEDILKKYKEAGFFFVEKEKMDEWIAVVFY
jgi:ribosomal protein L11 methyltransferase